MTPGAPPDVYRPDAADLVDAAELDEVPDMPAPDVMAAETVPLLAALICAHREGDLSRVALTIADQEPKQLQALVMALTWMVPSTTQLPAPSRLAALLTDIYTYAPITPSRAAHNRHALADAIGVLPPADDETAVCSRCEQRKPHSDFYPDSSTPSGRAYRCKVCSNKMRRSHAARTARTTRQPHTARVAAAGGR
jgi:hypothetical protein